MKEIPVIASLPFVVSTQCRDRLAERVSSGYFAFPQSVDPDAVTLGILEDRDSIVEANAGLRDPLTDLIPPAQETSEQLALMCRAEMVAARTMRRTGISSERYVVADLRAALVAARHACGLSDTAERRTMVRTNVSAGERSTLYPDPRKIPVLLATVDQILVGMGNEDVAMSATFAYCAAVHSQPFQDGNKRTARVLWSAMAAYREADTIPLALLSNLNRRAFAINSRRVLLFGIWEPLLLQLLDATEACHTWMRRNILR